MTGSPDHDLQFRIVGEVLLPGGANPDGALANGALTTLDGLHSTQPDAVPGQFIVKCENRADRTAAYSSLQRDFGATVLRARPSNDVENVHRVRGLPLLLAGLLAIIGSATIGHALVTSVRHRRREIAVAGCALVAVRPRGRPP